MNTLVGITGGIGAGKSVVSRILTSMGYEVYDSDTKARFIMDNSETIKERLATLFGEDIIADGTIDRKKLGEIVFSDNNKLELLNRLVHRAVIDDVLNWREQFEDGTVFIETAILYQSGLDRIVDTVWLITAPHQIRIERVMARNGLSANEVERRIAAQNFSPERQHPRIETIVNDGMTPLLPQVMECLGNASAAKRIYR